MSNPPTDDQLAERQILVNLIRKAEELEQDLRVLDHAEENRAIREGVLAPLYAKIRPYNAALEAWVEGR